MAVLFFKESQNIVKPLSFVGLAVHASLNLWAVGQGAICLPCLGTLFVTLTLTCIAIANVRKLYAGVISLVLLVFLFGISFDRDKTRVGQPTEAMKIWDERGQEVSLDLSQKPALMFSWWCTPCVETLKIISAIPQEKQPYLISVYLKDDYINQTRLKLKETGVEQAYYSSFDPGVIPCLVWVEDRRIHIAHGVEMEKKLKEMR